MFQFNIPGKNPLSCSYVEVLSQFLCIWVFYIFSCMLLTLNVCCSQQRWQSYEKKLKSSPQLVWWEVSGSHELYWNLLTRKCSSFNYTFQPVNVSWKIWMTLLDLDVEASSSPATDRPTSSILPEGTSPRFQEMRRQINPSNCPQLIKTWTTRNMVKICNSIVFVRIIS